MKGADVTFDNGFRREVKSITGGFNSFNREASHAADQLVGPTGVAAGEVFVQVKAGTDVSNWAERFAGKRSPEQQEKYSNVTLRVVDDNGKELYSGPLAPPKKDSPPPSADNEGC